MRAWRAIGTLCVVLVAGCAQSGLSGPRAVGRPPAAPSVGELVERGRAFAAVGDLTRAEQYLSASLERGADQREILPVLVRVCLQAGRFRVAGDYVRQALRRDPENDRLHLLLGVLEQAVGDRPAAQRELALVLRTRPDDSDGHYAMGVLLRDGDDPAGADAEFRAYLRLTPDGVHAADARSSLLQEAP